MLDHSTITQEMFTIKMNGCCEFILLGFTLGSFYYISHFRRNILSLPKTNIFFYHTHYIVLSSIQVIFLVILSFVLVSPVLETELRAFSSLGTC